MKPINRTAILLALATAMISGGANFISKIAVTIVKDPIAFTFLKNGLVAVFFVGLIVSLGRWKELRNLNRSQWIRLATIGLIGGSVPFILYFTGLTMTSAVSASFIHKTMFIWVAMLAIPFLKERLHWIQGAAFLLLIGGTVALLGSKPFTFGTGEGLILLATMFWAVENIVAKKALASISSTIVGASRMIFGSVILFGVVIIQGKAALLTGLSSIQWGWTLLIAVFLCAYVLTWFAALKRAPATIVSSLLVPASLITSTLTLIFQNKSFSSQELASGIFFLIGIALIVFHALKFRKSNASNFSQKTYN